MHAYQIESLIFVFVKTSYKFLSNLLSRSRTHKKLTNNIFYFVCCGSFLNKISLGYVTKFTAEFAHFFGAQSPKICSLYNSYTSITNQLQIKHDLETLSYTFSSCTIKKLTRCRSRAISKKITKYLQLVHSVGSRIIASCKSNKFLGLNHQLAAVLAHIRSQSPTSCSSCMFSKVNL